MTSVAMEEPCTQVYRCPTCRVLLTSLVDACPEPRCVERQNADEARWERWHD